jgi:hypothetical protein
LPDVDPAGNGTLEITQEPLEGSRGHARVLYDQVEQNFCLIAEAACLDLLRVLPGLCGDDRAPVCREKKRA